jgi:hypothetical protein
MPSESLWKRRWRRTEGIFRRSRRDLIRKIRMTHATSRLPGGGTLPEAIARRGAFVRPHSLVQHALTSGTRDPVRCRMAAIREGPASMSVCSETHRRASPATLARSIISTAKRTGRPMGGRLLPRKFRANAVLRWQRGGGRKTSLGVFLDTPQPGHPGALSGHHLRDLTRHEAFLAAVPGKKGTFS